MTPKSRKNLPVVKNSKPAVLILVGPTASGKSELAVKLAKKFNGEIISCDSRQIYKGMDIGTGKVPGKWQLKNKFGAPGYDSRHSNRVFIYKNIPHHLIDFVSPTRQYTVSLFQVEAKKAIADVTKRGKLPILCGGTAHWIDAVIFNQNLPDVKPNKKLRAELEKKSAAELFAQIKKQDPARAATIDKFNKRRLIRALEIIISTGKPVPALNASRYALGANSLWLGIKTNQTNLYKKIEARLKQRLKAGMIKEVARLHRQGLSYKHLEQFGLEYRYISLYLQKKITYQEMFEQLLYAIKHYSKRQLTWWKKNREIEWIEPDIKKASRLTALWLKKDNSLL